MNQENINLREKESKKDRGIGEGWNVLVRDRRQGKTALNALIIVRACSAKEEVHKSQQDTRIYFPEQTKFATWLSLVICMVLNVV